jgi:molecular chaperone GrpE
MVDELRKQRRRTPRHEGAGQDHAETPATQATGEAPDATADLEAQLKAARAEAAENWEKYLRCRAEMENYRRRVEATYAQLARESRRKLLRRFLEVLDNLDRAIAASSGASSPEPLLEGIELTRKQFLALLEQEGVRPIPALGQPFDPRLHEAIGTVAVPDAEGTVVREALRGYVVDDDLLRPARVIVATHEESPNGGHEG